MCFVLTNEWSLTRPTVCYYTEDNKPLIIFGSNDHCFKIFSSLSK